MDSCKGLKRLFELGSCDSGQKEGSQNKTNQVETKRQRTPSETTSEDNFEEFLALLDRIQYMKTKHMNFCISEEILVREDLDVKGIRTKSPSLPSFEWEDFCVPTKRDISTFDTKYNPRSSEKKRKQEFRPANYHRKGSSSDAYENCHVESFDLNVEASPNLDM